MAFFNLTQLGVQDPIKAALKEEEKADVKVKKSRSGPTVSTLADNNGNQKYPSEAQGSYVKYTERLTKHQRTNNCK